MKVEDAFRESSISRAHAPLTVRWRNVPKPCAEACSSAFASSQNVCGVALVVSACGAFTDRVCENAGTCTSTAKEVAFCEVQLQLVEQVVVVRRQPVLGVE